MQITLKTDPETQEQYIDLEDLKSILDITKVDSYTMTIVDGCLVLKFYDKYGEEIK